LTTAFLTVVVLVIIGVVVVTLRLVTVEGDLASMVGFQVVRQIGAQVLYQQTERILFTHALHIKSYAIVRPSVFLTYLTGETFMPLPRATNYRSTGLSQPTANQYVGNAFVYVLASRIDPNLCKIGKGNPTTRCNHWNINSPHGGVLNNNLSVFAAYEFATETEALEYESQAHAIYNFVNLNPNAAGGEQEFFAVPPQQVKATFDILHAQYAQAANTARLVAEAMQEGYDKAPVIVAQREAAAAAAAQREAAERAQRESDAVWARIQAAESAQREAVEQARRDAAAWEEIETAQRETAERAQREAAAAAQREAAVLATIEATGRAQREAAERAQREKTGRTQREAAERAQRETAERAQREAAARVQNAKRAQREVIARAQGDRVLSLMLFLAFVGLAAGAALMGSVFSPLSAYLV
jgi:hypothetical protein